MGVGELRFPDGFSEADEQEAEVRGYLVGAVVELAGGVRYPVTFYDPVRLWQTMSSWRRNFFSEGPSGSRSGG